MLELTKLPQDFLDYIASFEKRPGEYSDDELLEIGIKHRSLGQSEKSWSDLTQLLGIPKSSEAYRNWVLRKISESALVSELVAESDEEKEVSPIEDEDFASTYKATTKNRDILNSYRRLLRDEARIETMREAMKEAVSSVNKLPSFKPAVNINTNNTTEAVLLLSDLHIGVECDNFYNKYNTKIAGERLSKVVDETINYCKCHNVSKLNILNLGDMIQGAIHLTARIEEEYDVIEQVMVASELICQALNKLQMAAPTVTYRSCSDNHSRVKANLAEHIEKEQFGRLIDWYVKERLKDSNIKFIDDNLDFSLGVFELLNGKKVAFAHGHLEGSADKSLQNFVGATKGFVDYVCLGHFHAEKLKMYQGVKVFVNGSIVGTEQYALSKRLFNGPTQTLLIFDKGALLNISLELD